MTEAIVIRSSQPPSVSSLLDPGLMLRGLWSSRSLVLQLAWRELTQRTRGTWLGLGWNILQPLVTLGIYTFVFGLVFKVRWERSELAAVDPRLDFVLHFFTGYLIFSFFSECLNTSSSLIINRPNLVRKVVFPIETLAVSTLVANLAQSAVGFVLLLVTLVVAAGPGALHPSLLVLPAVLLPLLMFTLGLMWFLASVGVFVRDIRHLVSILTQLWFFITPVFYPAEHVPEPFRALVWINPMAVIVDSARRVILWNRLPDWPSLAGVLVLAALVMMIGYAWFMKSRRGFADVL